MKSAEELRRMAAEARDRTARTRDPVIHQLFLSLAARLDERAARREAGPAPAADQDAVADDASGAAGD